MRETVIVSFPETTMDRLRILSKIAGVPGDLPETIVIAVAVYDRLVSVISDGDDIVIRDRNGGEETIDLEL